MEKVNPVQLEKFLSGLSYPATKEQIIDHAQENGADDNVLDTLHMLPERQYDGPTDINKEIGKTGSEDEDIEAEEAMKEDEE